MPHPGPAHPIVKSLNRARDRCVQRRERDRLRNVRFSIISNDCWGGTVYQRLRLRYTSPFVGLMMMAPDYLRLLGDLGGHLGAELTFVQRTRHADLDRRRTTGELPPYPIGVLQGDVEVHFLHYPSPEAARRDWGRRADRVDLDRLWVKFDGSKDYATAASRQAFDDLPYEHKVMFTSPATADVASAIATRTLQLILFSSVTSSASFHHFVRRLR